MSDSSLGPLAGAILLWVLVPLSPLLAAPVPADSDAVVGLPIVEVPARTGADSTLAVLLSGVLAAMFRSRLRLMLSRPRDDRLRG